MCKSRPEIAEQQWIPLDAAFLAMDLRIYEPEDRKAWEYFVSPLVRVKAVGRDSPIVIREPHRVSEGGQVEILLSREVAVVLVSREDVERAAENRYLFDSLAWTALDVGMRRIIPLYAEAENKPVPPAPDRAVEPYSSMSPLEFRTATREYLDQVGLNDYAERMEPRDLFLPFVIGSPASFNVLSPAWVVRQKNKLGYKDAVVAPLFLVSDISLLPEKLRDPWWFERNVRELVSLEKEELGATVASHQIKLAASRGREFLDVFNPAVTASPALVMMYAGVEGRQRAFLRKQPHQRVELEQTRCSEPTCAVLLSRGRGKPKKHCPACIVLGRNLDQESRERASHRNRERRRQRGVK